MLEIVIQSCTFVMLGRENQLLHAVRSLEERQLPFCRSPYGALWKKKHLHKQVSIPDPLLFIAHLEWLKKNECLGKH